MKHRKDLFQSADRTTDELMIKLARLEMGQTKVETKVTPGNLYIGPLRRRRTSHNAMQGAASVA